MKRTNHKLHVETVYVTENDLFGALKSLSDLDNDFNGNNGDEYLSDAAKENGCSSNQEYLLNCLRKEYENGDFEEEYEVVDAFCESWCGADSFFEEYNVVSHLTPENKVDYIVLAYIERQ